MKIFIFSLIMVLMLSGSMLADGSDPMPICQDLSKCPVAPPPPPSNPTCKCKR